ncbi:MAG: AAA family ATPase [Dehalococcoidia bacterium]|nr:AAA family ATPase [Dehalococcoidia bacterium]
MRMRPRTVDEFVGQDHLLGSGKALRRALEQRRLGSIILWGPPGTGKTSLAQLVVRKLAIEAHSLSAVTSGVADLRRVLTAARQSRAQGRRVALVLDEAHKWSRTQQEVLLPAVEDGLILLIGLTSENPYFDLVPALRSRVRILRLEPLPADTIRLLLERALQDEERGLGREQVEVAADALELLVSTSGGDARIALNGLEAAVDIAPTDEGQRPVTVETVEEAIQRRQVRYDQAGDDHYQTISAFIKSIRGSDPDGAVFWLAKMLKAGEDPRFIARRLVISASEDIGLADSQGLVVATAAYEAVERVGLPEAGLILAHATVYLATAPKSNSAAKAVWQAQAAIEAGASLEVPLHLRNASFREARQLGYGQEYEYSHDLPSDDPRRYQQGYLPAGVAGRYYQPGRDGAEASIRERVEQIRRWRSAGAKRPRKRPDRPR